MGRLHPVFNVIKLTPVPLDPIVGQCQTPPPPPELIDSEEEYLVEEILDSRMWRQKLQYLVKWEGYGIEHNTWEYSDNLDNAAEAVAELHSTHPGALHHICAMAFETILFHPVPLAFTSSRCSSRRGGGDCKGNTLTLHTSPSSMPALAHPSSRVHSHICKPDSCALPTTIVSSS